MSNAKLVLEVYEKDVDKAYNFVKLIDMIRDWEKKNV